MVGRLNLGSRGQRVKASIRVAGAAEAGLVVLDAHLRHVLRSRTCSDGTSVVDPLKKDRGGSAGWHRCASITLR